jgi:hypothetical protein
MVKWGAREDVVHQLLIAEVERALMTIICEQPAQGDRPTKRRRRRHDRAIKACSSVLKYSQDICNDFHDQVSALDVALRAGEVPFAVLDEFCTNVQNIMDGDAGDRPQGVVWDFLIDHSIGNSLVAAAGEQRDMRVAESAIDDQINNLRTGYETFFADDLLPSPHEVSVFYSTVKELEKNKASINIKIIRHAYANRNI